MGEAGTTNPPGAVQLEGRQAGAAVASVLPVLRLGHRETLLPQRKLRKSDKTAPSHPGVADMKDTVLPFERFKSSVQIIRTLSMEFHSESPHPAFGTPLPMGEGAGGEGHATRFQYPR